MDRPQIRHLYAHIPFCPAKCSYCAFVTHVGSIRLVEPYLGALRTEIRSQASARPNGPLSTVYLGGGTPSMLTPEQIGSVLHTIESVHGLEPDAEITMEAHPATVDPTKLHGFRQAGVTRISFGGESLHPDELSGLGRGHGPDRVLAVVEEARAARFGSINVDLIYGLPAQTLDSWVTGLASLVAARPEHISLYPLQIEPSTVFGRRHREGKLLVPCDEQVVEMYEAACEVLDRAGYSHYEIANWALPDHECRHNMAYWRDAEYLAAGVGAHAYLHPYRTENMRGTRRYFERLAAGQSPVVSREYIDRATELSERVVLSLRLLKMGLDLDDLARAFGPAARHRIEALAASAETLGHLRRDGSRLLLPESAVPLANEILDRFVLLDLPDLAPRSA